MRPRLDRCARPLPDARRLRRAGATLCALAAALLAAAAVRAEPRLGPQSGLPVPRFMSLKFDEVYGREGPSFEHPVVWEYRRRGLPVQVIEEDLDWRKVRDPDGDEVWIHKRVLESRRTAVVAGAPAALRRRPEPASPVAAVAEPGVLFEIKDCRDGWARVDGARAAGWLAQSALWGARCDG